MSDRQVALAFFYSGTTIGEVGIALVDGICRWA